MKNRLVSWRKRLGAVLLAACLGSTGAHAVIYIFDSSNNDESSGDVSGFSTLAQGFSVTGGPYSLAAVTVYLQGTGGGTFGVSIWTEESSLPEGKIADLQASSSPTVGANEYLPPAGGVTLQANTTYFIVAASTAADVPYEWEGGALPISPGPGTPTSIAVSTDGGSSWAAYSGNAAIMSMQVSVVPEPGEWALLGGGLCLGFALIRRRSRK